MAFKTATKKKLKLRLGLCGPSGSGKTFTGLTIASGLVGPGGRIAVLDTEHRSAEKYADLFAFDVDYLSENCSPGEYVKKIVEAERAGFDCLFIDSLTHAWSGQGGALQMVDDAARRSKAGNSYTAWRDVTPEHNRLIEAMLKSKMHIIASMRVKTEYILEDAGNGKKAPRRVGMAPIQRDGMEYEFDVLCDMDPDHVLMVGKTRCAAVDAMVVSKPSRDCDFVRRLNSWLDDGATATTTDSAEAVAAEPIPDPSGYQPKQLTAAELKAEAAKDRKSAVAAIIELQQKLGLDNPALKELATQVNGRSVNDSTLEQMEILRRKLAGIWMEQQQQQQEQETNA